MPNLAVFSTSVEVFLELFVCACDHGSLLYVRGGVSKSVEVNKEVLESSPRPWRCFHAEKQKRICVRVFSTSVEVFLESSSSLISRSSLRHVRGGVSICVAVSPLRPRSSPRPWRCFLVVARRKLTNVVFSTSVEVFPGMCELE